MTNFKKELIKFIVVLVAMFLGVLIFLGLKSVVVKYGVDYVRIISSVVGGFGLLMVIKGIRLAPSAEGKRLSFYAPGIVIGGALLCGAVLYWLTGYAGWFVFCLIVPMVVGGVIAGVKAEKGKGKPG